MDLVAYKQKAVDTVKRYRYVLLILALGVALMLIPGKSDPSETEHPVQITEQKEDTAQQLSRILAQIQGAGRVEVLLTLASGEKTVYQTDEDISTGENGTTRFDTVIITGSDRGQSGLIQQVNPPSYQGAIVVCQGADRPAVRLAIVEAVSKVTGLGADRISVLKMK